MTRYPRLLDGSMQETARLLPSRLSVTLNLTPFSTAEMVLPEGNPTVSVRQWVQLYGPDGSLGIFRVASVNTTYGSQQQVSLEHGIVSLEDATIPAETEELTGSMRSILQSILDSQNKALWHLGAVDVPDSESYTLTTDADILLQAMINAAALVSGYAFEFDQTTSPWTVSLRKLSDAVACECRMNRNISGINIKLDESGLVTRVTSSLLPGGYQDGPTVGTWGVISRPLDFDEDSEDDETATSAKAQKAATAYLEAHKSPAVSIEIDAIRLAEQTREPLDAFRLGTVCRAALTDWGVIAKERIVTLYYMDILSDPDEVRLTLSSPERDASNGLAGVQRSTTQLQSTTNNNTRRITSAFKHITETENAVKIQADQIELQGKDILAQAETIRLHAERMDETDEGMETLKTDVVISVDGLRETITQGDKTIAELKSTVDGLEHWVTDADGNVSELTNTVRGLKNTVTAADGRVSVLTNTADGLTNTLYNQGEALSEFKTRIDEISSTVKDTNGDVGTLITKSDSVTAKVSNAEGRVSQLAVTADGLSYALSEQGEELSSIKAKIDEISLTVKDTNGDVGTLITKSDSVTAKVSNAEGRVSQLAVTADGLSYALSEQGEELSSIKAKIDEISLSVKDTNGAMGQLIVKSDSITQKMTNVDGKITAMVQLTDERFSAVLGDIETVEGDIKTITGSALWQKRNSIAAIVGKMYVGDDGNLYIVEGSGLNILKNGVAYGFYTENNLTAGLLVEKINGSTSAKLKADRIDLQGYVTASEFSSISAELGNVTTGTTQASLLYTQNLTATGVVRLAGHTCTWSTMKVVTGVSLKKEYETITDANGIGHVVISSVTASLEHETINYLGYGGAA